MKRTRWQLLSLIIGLFSCPAYSEEWKAEPEMNLHSQPSIGSALGIWIEGRLFDVHQLDGIKVAIVEGEPYKPVPAGEIMITGMDELKEAATQGDATAEHILARFHLEGRQHMSKDRVEAYKWAALAALHGQKASAALIRELTFFMKPDEISRARQAVMDHIKRRLEQL